MNWKLEGVGITMNKLVIVTVIVVWAICGTITIYQLTNDKEKIFVETSDCEFLSYYIEAGDDGKDFFAIWTYETKETVNFKIHEDMVETAKKRYAMECNDNV